MFKERLKAIRKENNFTQRQMANFLNMTVTGYASWEQGISQPNIDMILRLCKILNTTPNELLLEKDYEYSFEYNANGTKLIHKEKYKK